MSTAPAIPDSRIWSGTDTAGLLTGLVAVMFAIPAVLVVGPLGAAGTPAQLVGMVLFVLWLGQRLLYGAPTGGRRWMSIVMSVFAMSIVAAYAMGMLRPISGEEVRSADRGLLSLIAWMGIALTVSDGLRTRRTLDRVLITLGLAGGALALLGTVQFFTGLDIANAYRIPGLTPNGELGQLLARSQFFRVSGTATHPIEFGVVLTATLPLTLHYAFRANGALKKWLWAAVIAVGVALPLSVARSALLGAVVVLVFLLPTWPGKVRVRALVAIAIATVAMSAVVPGLVGTLRGLVFNASGDPSTQGRVDDYGPVLSYAAEAPWFGRGAFTFLPSIYRTLDNQYLGTLVEGGILGLLGLLVLLGGSVGVAFHIRGRSRDDATRSLAISLAASVTVVAVSAATFDALGFPLAAGVLFLVIGSIGALERLSGGVAVDVSRSEAGLRRRRWLPDVAFLLAAVAFVGAIAVAVSYRPPIQGSVSFLLVNRPPDGKNVYLTPGNTALAAQILRDLLDEQSTRDRIFAAGGVGDYAVAVGDGSLARWTDVEGYGAALRLVVTEPGPREAEQSMNQLVPLLDSEAAALQDRAGIAPSARLVLQPIASGVQYVQTPANTKRAIGGFALLFGIVMTSLIPATESMRLLRRRLRRTGTEREPAAATTPEASPHR